MVAIVTPMRCSLGVGFDYLPLVPIVEQAGGVISDWQGNALNLQSGPQVIAAATPELHEAALAALN
jgi:inositol-phosphate phosphatase/L-galactose 1-phosphate phosphatase/histidinol-phosphatase